MALVNPNIAMSFRQPEFTPRNALAEYAQIQQIQGGQRQAEVADMQLRRMRQEDEDIERIHQIAMKNGGPDNRMEMGRALFASRNPTQRELGYKILQHEEAVRAYNSEFGPGAMAAPAMPSSAPNAMVAPSAPATPSGELVAAPITPPTGVMREIAPGGAMGAEMPLTRGAPANALAPAAPAPANALALPAAAPVNALSPAATAPNIDALRRQYGMAVAAGRSDAPVLLKQIEAALRGEQVRAPKITVLGVAKGTETPVYFDEYANQQFTIGAGPSGQQVRVPYMGGVNRSTSTVTATATSTGGKLEGAEQKGQGELNIKDVGEIRAAAKLAQKTLPAIETQARILDQGFTTGFGTEFKKAGASVLAALGVQNAEKFATNAQTFIAATQQAVLQKQLEQKGTQTAADADRITQTGAQLGNTVNGNRFIIDVAKAQLKRDIDQRDFYAKWWSNKKTYEGAEDAWYAGEGGKSLFDRPELKKYVAPTAAETNQRQQGLADIFKPKPR
jgi:hypothetical protein